MKRFILIFFLIACLPFQAFAMQEAENPTYYVFDLSYDGAILSRSEGPSPVPYDFSYEQDMVLRGANTGRVYSLGNDLLGQFLYDLKIGRNEVYVPFFSNAGNIQFLDQNGSILYQYDISGISTCNRNNACEVSLGEDSQSCPTDCKKPASADVPNPLYSHTYKFNLSFNNGRLALNSPGSERNYELVIEEFVDNAGLYYGKVLSASNQQLAEFHYDLLEGNNEVKAPYFSEARTVAFYRTSTDKDPLLVADVSQTAGASGSVSGSTPSNSIPAAQQNSPVSRLYDILIIAFIVLGIATVAIFVIIFLRRNRNQ